MRPGRQRVGPQAVGGPVGPWPTLDSAALARYLEAERSYGYPWQVYAACDRAEDSRGASRQGVEGATAALAGSGDTLEMSPPLPGRRRARKKAQRELARLDTAAFLLAGKTFPLDVSNQRRDYTIRHNYTDSAEPFGGKVHRAWTSPRPVGTEVRAVGDGVVEKLAWDEDLGYVLILNCDGLRVEYGHLKSYADTVAQGSGDQRAGRRPVGQHRRRREGTTPARCAPRSTSACIRRRGRISTPIPFCRPGRRPPRG